MPENLEQAEVDYMTSHHYLRFGELCPLHHLQLLEHGGLSSVRST